MSQKEVSRYHQPTAQKENKNPKKWSVRRGRRSKRDVNGNTNGDNCWSTTASRQGCFAHPVPRNVWYTSLNIWWGDVQVVKKVKNCDRSIEIGVQTLNWKKSRTLIGSFPFYPTPLHLDHTWQFQTSLEKLALIPPAITQWCVIPVWLSEQPPCLRMRRRKSQGSIQRIIPPTYISLRNNST